MNPSSFDYSFKQSAAIARRFVKNGKKAIAEALFANYAEACTFGQACAAHRASLKKQGKQWLVSVQLSQSALMLFAGRGDVLDWRTK